MSKKTLFDMFTSPPDKRTGPLFWQHGESREKLLEYVDRIADSGNGHFTIESRPHPHWLEKPWFDDCRLLCERAREKGLNVWLFDEEFFPSFVVGGRVPKKHRYKKARVRQTTVTFFEEISGVHVTERKRYAAHEVFAAAVVAVSDGVLQLDSLADIRTVNVREFQSLEEQHSEIRVLEFYYEYTTEITHNNFASSLDGFDPEAVQWLIDTLYQRHVDELSEFMDGTILGFFYDEPELHGDFFFGMIEYFSGLGMDGLRCLTAHLCDCGERGMPYRFQFADSVIKHHARTLFGTVQNWCHDHGLKLIGHFNDHNHFYNSNVLASGGVGAGNLFEQQKYSDMGGIDVIWKQGWPGSKDWNWYLLPKYASSVAHMYDMENHDTMSEQFGAAGWGLTYETMYYITNWQAVRGVNFPVPHAFNPKYPDVDAPPYYYYSGHNKQWPEYARWAGYSNRVSSLLSGGDHVCPVALLFNGAAEWIGRFECPEKATDDFMAAQYDVDWLTHDVFVNDAQIEKGVLRLHNEVYRVIYLPGCEGIRPDVIDKLDAFVVAGGIVIGGAFLPSRSLCPAVNDFELCARVHRIWNPANERVSRLSTTSCTSIKEFLQQCGLRPTLDVLSGETYEWFYVLHRRKEDCDIFFLHNACPFNDVMLTVSVETGRAPEVWNPATCSKVPLKFKQAQDGRYEGTIAMQQFQALFLISERSEK